MGHRNIGFTPGTERVWEKKAVELLKEKRVSK
jgi:hypothetical protein